MLGSTFGNFFQFLFNLFMSRNLSVTDYGVLASLISLIMLPAVFSNALLPTIVSFAATFYAKNEIPLVRSLFVMIGKFAFVLGLVILLLFILFAKHIGAFFHIDNIFLIYLAGVNVFIGYITVLNMAIIKAKLAFRFLSFLGFLAAFLKFAFGVGFVLLGYSVFGAMAGMVSAAFVAYIISFIPIRSVFKVPSGNTKLQTTDVLKFAAPSALVFFSLTSFTTIDIVLVKHFFPPDEAGLYAGLSLIGRVIFFFSAPVNMVLLPLFTQKHTKDELSGRTVLFSLLLILLPSVFITGFYALFPNFVIQFFLKNPDYLTITPYVTLFAVFITLYSLVYVLSNIFLSMKKTIIFIPLSIGALSQIIFISLFHTSFLPIIVFSTSVMAILLCTLLLYYWKVSRVQTNGKTKNI